MRFLKKAKMKETTKRHISAIVLLAVFLPMLVLSSLHVHPETHLEDEHCEECMHHVPHAGHMGSQTTCSFDCVLCQFPTLCRPSEQFLLVCLHTLELLNQIEFELG